MPRKAFGVALALTGVYFIMTCQGWGFALIKWVGYERALGVSSVQRQADGSVIFTNPTAMVLWTLPFLMGGGLLVLLGLTTGFRRRPVADWR